jgi:hypothetical protein
MRISQRLFIRFRTCIYDYIPCFTRSMSILQEMLEMFIYRVIHKSLRDFRPLRYSNPDGNAEGEHVNRGRDTLSFCPTLQVLDMSTLGDAADVKFGNFGKFQDTERFFIPCPRHVSSRLLPSDKTCKYTTAPNTHTKLGEILYLFI